MTLSTLSQKWRSLLRYRVAFKNWPIAATARYLGERLGEERLLEGREGARLLFRPGQDHVALGEIFVTDNYIPCLGMSDVRHIWDIGGNIGCFVIWAYPHYSQAQFHSFEPNPASFAQLSKNRELNPQIDWHLHPIGLSDVNASLQGYTGDRNNSGVAGQFTKGGTSFEMKLRRASELWIELGKPSIDILKVDCEGGEYGILRDLDGPILDGVRVLILEYHPVPGESAVTLRDILTRHGFQFDWPGGDLNVVVATRS